jgi:hypothetical protein
MATSAYDCTTDDEGVYRLDAFPAIECWDTYTGSQVLGIVLSIVYVGLWTGARSANDDGAATSDGTNTWLKKTLLVRRSFAFQVFG